MAIAVLVATTAIAYSPALRGPQLFDDRQAIQDNASITSFGAALHPPAGTPVTGRPVANLTFAFNYWLNTVLGIDQRADPEGVAKTVSYHIVNVFLHIVNGLLLFGILRRTLRTHRIPERWREHADIVAIGVTALWLLHPLQTEAVDYLTQRTELVAGLCYLATLYSSIRAWDGSRGWFVAGTIACLLGMGAKEVMFSAPIIVVLYDRAFHYTAWRDPLAPAQKARRWFYAALAGTWSLLITLIITAPRGASVGFHSGVSWYEYLHSQGWAIVHYLRLVMVPTALSIDYDFHLLENWRGLPGLLVLTLFGVATIAAWTRANRWGWAAFLGSWFFLILAPSSSVVPILTEIVAERRMYLPLAAVLLMLAILAERTLRFVEDQMRLGKGTGLRPAELRLAVALLAAVVAIVLGGSTYDRSALYRDPEAIWRDAIAKVPYNPRAWNNLGALVASDRSATSTDAELFYRKALALDSSYVDALVNVGMSALRHGNKAEAEQRFRRVLLLDPSNHLALGGLGSLLLDLGDTTAALPMMERFAGGNVSSEFLTTLGQVLIARHRNSDAIDIFRRAVEQAPDRADLMTYLGGILLQQGHSAEAEHYLAEVQGGSAPSPLNLALLSLAFADQGHTADAVDAAARAVSAGAPDERVWFFAGRAMLDDHRADLAADYFLRATTLAPRDADAVAELGEADLALGKRQEATEMFERALRIDPADSTARAGLVKVR